MLTFFEEKRLRWRDVFDHPALKNVPLPEDVP